MKIQSSNSAWIRRASIAAVAATVVAGCTFGAALPANASDASAYHEANVSLINLRAAGYVMWAGAAITAPNSTIHGRVGSLAAITEPGAIVEGVGTTSKSYSVAPTITTDAATYSRYATDASAATNAVASAYASVVAVTGMKELPGADLGGTKVYPGVWHMTSAIAMTSNITIDSEGSSAPIIIVTDGALNTTAGTTVALTKGTKASNIFWVTAGAATLGASSNFAGNIISDAAITVGAGTTVDGRLYSVNDAITLDNNSINSTYTGE